MSVLLFIQNVITVLIAVAILAAPAYKNVKWCLFISGCLAASFMIVQALLTAFFDVPQAAPPIGYFIILFVIFAWMMAIRLVFRVVSKIVLATRNWWTSRSRDQV